MHNFEASYDLILKELRKISNQENFYYKPIHPKLSDLELMSLIILAEYQSIDSEHQLFRNIVGTSIEGKIERSVYNRRKRKLFPYMEQIRQQMVKQFNEFENYFVVDSMPLEVCKMSRSSRSSICKENTDAFPEKAFALHNNCIFMAINYMLFAL